VPHRFYSFLPFLFISLSHVFNTLAYCLSKKGLAFLPSGIPVTGLSVDYEVSRLPFSFSGWLWKVFDVSFTPLFTIPFSVCQVSRDVSFKSGIFFGRLYWPEAKALSVLSPPFLLVKPFFFSRRPFVPPPEPLDSRDKFSLDIEAFRGR